MQQQVKICLDKSILIVNISLDIASGSAPTDDAAVHQYSHSSFLFSRVVSTTYGLLVHQQDIRYRCHHHHCQVYNYGTYDVSRGLSFLHFSHVIFYTTCRHYNPNKTVDISIVRYAYVNIVSIF